MRRSYDFSRAELGKYAPRCGICKRVLNNPSQPVISQDCGGDCLLCMAEVAEDPDCIAALEMEMGRSYCIEAEVQWIFHRINYEAPVRDVELLVADWNNYETQSKPFWRAQ